MDRIAAALGDAARWRIVELLAERPRSVGELAEGAGLRQPQTTKHLQTLARAGVVAVHPLGQRRVYALEATALSAFADRLRALVDAADAQEAERDVLTRYRAAIEAESARADQEGWADGRSFGFERVLAAPPEVVWGHWVDPDLLAGWWAPPSMAVVACTLEPREGGRAVLEYRDGDGRRYRSDGTVHAAVEPKRLVFDLAVRDAAGAVSFTGHYDLALAAVSGGTRLRLGLRVTETSVAAVPHLAGIEIGWAQVLDNLANTLTGKERS